MNIDIKKYSNISYIEINEKEEIDIKKGVLDILQYASILQNIAINNDIQKNYTLITRYRTEKINTLFDQEEIEIIYNNAPKKIKNYFVVPHLITRKF
jgi:aspartyl/glutamyl-tRNA(Asn/Gln) amidotransferase C subunit